MDTLTAIGLGALVFWITAFLKDVSALNWNGIVSRVIAASAGIAAVLVYSQTDWAAGVFVGNDTLASLNGWEQVLLGLTLSSGAGVAHDTLRAVNPADDSTLGKFTE